MAWRNTPPRRLTAVVELLGWQRRKEQRAVTRSGDEKAWKEFVSWCRARGLRAMPANPWTLAAYARWCEGRHRLPAIARTFKAIARVHGSKSRRRPERHPTVTCTLNLIKTRANAKTRVKAQGKGRAKYADLFREDDFLEAGLPKKPKKASPARNKAKTKGKRRLGFSSSPKLVSRLRLKN